MEMKSTDVSVWSWDGTRRTELEKCSSYSTSMVCVLFLMGLFIHNKHFNAIVLLRGMHFNA